jgi:hypothetical protein
MEVGARVVWRCGGGRPCDGNLGADITLLLSYMPSGPYAGPEPVMLAPWRPYLALSIIVTTTIIITITIMTARRHPVVRQQRRCEADRRQRWRDKGVSPLFDSVGRGGQSKGTTNQHHKHTIYAPTTGPRRRHYRVAVGSGSRFRSRLPWDNIWRCDICIIFAAGATAHMTSTVLAPSCVRVGCLLSQICESRFPEVADPFFFSLPLADRRELRHIWASNNMRMCGALFAHMHYLTSNLHAYVHVESAMPGRIRLDEDQISHGLGTTYRTRLGVDHYGGYLSSTPRMLFVAAYTTPVLSPLPSWRWRQRGRGHWSCVQRSVKHHARTVYYTTTRWR